MSAKSLLSYHNSAYNTGDDEVSYMLPCVLSFYILLVCCRPGRDLPLVSLLDSGVVVSSEVALGSRVK